MDGFDFIDEYEGQLYYIKDEANVRVDVPLIDIFEKFRDSWNSADDVADEIEGLEEIDVRNAVRYWTSVDGVYERLVEESGSYIDEGGVSHQDHVFPGDRSQESSGVVEGVMRSLIAGRDEFGLRNLVSDLENEVPGTEFKLEWERNGSDLAVYAGSISDDTIYVTYAVDDELGTPVKVDIAEVDRILNDAVNNAVYKAL